MATNSQGVVIQFAGDDIGEVLSVSVDDIEADAVELTPRSRATRDKQYRPADLDYGTLAITFLDTGAFTVSRVGEVGQLYVTRGTTLFAFDAMLQSLAWRANVGELQQLTAVFKLGART